MKGFWLSQYRESDKLHISHLYQYVSAYEPTEIGINELINDLEVALKKSQKSQAPIIVDQDGEMFFVVYPSGQIHLCLPWKKYTVWRQNPDIVFAIGFTNPERGFPAGPFPTLKEALEEGGKVDLFGEDCYLYRISGSSARRIRKWNFIEDKWEFIK